MSSLPIPSAALPVLALALAVCLALPGDLGAETPADRRARLLAPAADFTRPEPHEAFQGGSGTNRTRLGRGAFSQPSAALAFEDRTVFLLGAAVFERPWVVAPSSTLASDGLGPLFNARSCAGCHIRGGRGRPPEPGEGVPVSLVAKLGTLDDRPDPVFGRQLQVRAVPGLAAEGRFFARYAPLPFAYPDGSVVTLHRPRYDSDAKLAPGVALKPRVAPPMIGLGLIEAIAEADILARADPADADGDGISGRVHWLDRGGVPVPGRFGWKATAADLREQSADAFLHDMGLATTPFPAAWGDCTATQADCRGAIHGDEGGGPEIADDLLDLVTHHVRTLAVPARRDPGDAAVLEGKRLFQAVGCPACHVPKFATAPEAPPDRRNQLIWPYSDFLLHDMGPGLADPVPTGGAGAAEWRTPPLWGIGLTAAVSGHTRFLHDGRARSLEEAILWHDGEARAARDAFAARTAAERAKILRFLESL